MKLDNISRVEQTTNTVILNGWLKDGAKVLKIISSKNKNVDGEEVTALYVVGWEK